MRVLQLTVEPPWPAISGADIRNAAVAAACAGQGPVLTVSLAAGPAASLPEGVRAHVLSGHETRRHWSFDYPEHPTRYAPKPSEITELRDLCDAFQPDAVILEGVALGGFLPWLAERGLPLILDMHNLESDLLHQTHAAKPWRKKLFSTGVAKASLAAARRDDETMARSVGQVWVCSQAEARIVAAMAPRSDTRHIPNPIPDESVLALPIHVERYASLDILFCGNLSYPPNVGAAVEIAGQLTPALRRHKKPFSVTLAGRNPHKTLLRLPPQRELRIIDGPQDMRPLLAGASFSVMPIRYGGGTRIKAIEAFCAGLVVVATKKAVEGLDAMPGEHYIAAETASEAANRLIELSAAPHEAAALAECARKWVTQNHAADRISVAIQSALRDVQTRNAP